MLVDTTSFTFTSSLLVLISYFLEKDKGFENNTCVFSVYWCVDNREAIAKLASQVLGVSKN